eukprot:CAMPEP_0201946188 /NCGR_PEP_ID=MMETSP0903-20130614/54292_1 /ASSEMBLY_ACC=CAM_ASM_000552 /TAXON_ID=420261 /ORGANISM="Thalassiosira antarctica, Strain CCMP982" /LENGTH=416 /DNA_ID=CAMNT_0048489283 /DNA_START=33 /DNA_END=1283 /DNA_ORIENTATION=-
MRQSYKHIQKGGKPAYHLKASEIAALENVGFRWRILEKERVAIKITSFAERIEHLKEHKSLHGHIQVSHSKNQALSSFCSQIRAARRHPEHTNLMKLTEDRIQQLDELGFDWNPGPTGPQTKHPPSGDKKPDDNKSEKMNDTKRKRKGAKSTTAPFSVGFEALKVFYSQHGHLRVTKKESKRLAAFCWSVRFSRRNPAHGLIELTEEKIQQLTELGFDWGPPRDGDRSKFKASLEKQGAGKCKHEKAKRRNRNFSERIEELKAFYNKHGHLKPSKKDNKDLHVFCCRVRYARRAPGKAMLNLSTERINALDAIHFDWEQNSTSTAAIHFGWEQNSTSTAFSGRVAALKAYKEKHGHLNVKQAEDKSLADFCSNIILARRNIGKKGFMRMTEDRITSLDAIGFDWKLECTQEKAAAK